jgi:hypothetical protein
MCGIGGILLASQAAGRAFGAAWTMAAQYSCYLSGRGVRIIQARAPDAREASEA